MKKILVIAVIIVFAATVLSSCRSQKPPCPAYRQASVNIEMPTPTS